MAWTRSKRRRKPRWSRTAAMGGSTTRRRRKSSRTWWAMTRLARHSANIDRAGFTRIESMIASVILAVAVVGISGMLAATYQQSKEQISAAEATQLARQL